MIGGEEIYGTTLAEFVFTILCLMLALNLAYFVYCTVTDCMRKRRIK